MPKPKLSDDDLMALLDVIKRFALSAYPFPDESDNDGTLALALGQIAGIAMQAISDAKRRKEWT